MTDATKEPAGGFLVRVDPETKEIVYSLDLNRLQDSDEPLGWCRGVEVIGDRAFVGLTRIRESKHASYRFWKRSTGPSAPSRILEVDLIEKGIVSTHVLAYEGCAVYSILAWD